MAVEYSYLYECLDTLKDGVMREMETLTEECFTLDRDTIFKCVIEKNLITKIKNHFKMIEESESKING